MALYRQCFVPTCENDTKNSPGKTFARIREDLREIWCRQVNIQYYTTYTMYCCEDHFDPPNDLKNYGQHKYYGTEPKLKPNVSLRYVPPISTDSSNAPLLVTVKSKKIGRKNSNNSNKSISSTLPVNKVQDGTQCGIRSADKIMNNKTRKSERIAVQPTVPRVQNATQIRAAVKHRNHKTRKYKRITNIHRVKHIATQCDFPDKNRQYCNDAGDILLPQACSLIYKVYNYLNEEYRYIKSINSDSFDLSLLSNILQRTAKATGVAEKVVKDVIILEDNRIDYKVALFDHAYSLKPKSIRRTNKHEKHETIPETQSHPNKDLKQYRTKTQDGPSNITNTSQTTNIVNTEKNIRQNISSQNGPWVLLKPNFITDQVVNTIYHKKHDSETDSADEDADDMLERYIIFKGNNDSEKNMENNTEPPAKRKTIRDYYSENNKKLCTAKDSDTKEDKKDWTLKRYLLNEECKVNDYKPEDRDIEVEVKKEELDGDLMTEEFMINDNNVEEEIEGELVMKCEVFEDDLLQREENKEKLIAIT